MYQASTTDAFLEMYEFVETAEQPPTVFRKKGVLKNFAIFTSEQLCWSLFGVNFIKKRLQHDFFKNTYF